MRKIILTLFISILLVNFSCTESSDNNPKTPQDIIDKSLAHFNGNVIEQSFEQEEGVDSWEIKIANENGAEVKFYWSTNGQFLIKMEGLNGPFDYDIMPGNGLINFSTANKFAKGAVKNESIIKWRLKQEEEFIGNWVYTFEFLDKNGGSSKVYIDASNGDILEIK